MNTQKNDDLPSIVRVDKDLNLKLLQHYKGERHGYVQVGQKKWFYPQKYEKLAHGYRNFKVRSDDIWILGYPRSGTTVTQEIAWLISHELDFEQAKNNPLGSRVPFFEGNLVMNDVRKQEYLSETPEDARKQKSDSINKFGAAIEILNNRSDKRVIKTHLPIELLPSDLLTCGAKIIYVCRYPKDVAVSYYHLQMNNPMIQFRGNFESYWNLFKQNLCMFTPYFSHVKMGWDIKDLPNVNFVFYENLGQDLKTYVNQLATFLNKSLTTSEMEQIIEFVSFDNFKNRVNGEFQTKTMEKGADSETGWLVRKGKAGGWKNYFTESMNEEADKWIEENEKSIGINFPKI